MLSNSESWYNLSTIDIKYLESIDEQLIRRVFNAHSKTAIEFLYLESGNIPIRFLLKTRRLNFLWYILNEGEETLLHKFFDAQCQNPVKSDWVITVKQDLSDLELVMDFQEIKKMPKSRFKRIVKDKVKSKALEYLLNLQKTHSKLTNLSYNEMKLQDYLRSNNSLTIKEKCFTFAARSRMIDVHCNFKVGKQNLKCRKCRNMDEDQKHLLECPALADNGMVPVNKVPLYEDLFKKDVTKIEVLGKLLLTKFKALTSLTNNITMCTSKDGAAVNHLTELD